MKKLLPLFAVVVACSAGAPNPELTYSFRDICPGARTPIHQAAELWSDAGVDITWAESADIVVCAAAAGPYAGAAKPGAFLVNTSRPDATTVATQHFGWQLVGDYLPRGVPGVMAREFKDITPEFTSADIMFLADHGIILH